MSAPYVAQPRDTRSPEEREQAEAAHRYEVLLAIAGDHPRRAMILAESDLSETGSA